MKYYKAIPQEEKPFVLWLLVAENEAELIEKGLSEDPLVLPEDKKPAYVNGVSPITVKGNELQQASAEDIRLYGIEYDNEQRVLKQSSKSLLLEKSVFDYKDNQFPMNEIARLHYSIIARNPKNYKVLHVGGIYDLQQQDVTEFISAYYNQLEILIQPIV